MEGMRQTPPEIAPLRLALRGVREALRDQRARLETDVTRHLPPPASRLACHVLRDLDEVAYRVDGLASVVADRLFGAAEPPPPLMAPRLAPPPAASAATKDPGSGLAARIARRLELAAPPKAAFPAGMTAEDAAAAYGAEAAALADPRARLALFAIALARLAAGADAAEAEALADSAADLALALEPELTAASRSGTPAPVARLLAKYAAHV